MEATRQSRGIRPPLLVGCTYDFRCRRGSSREVFKGSCKQPMNVGRVILLWPRIRTRRRSLPISCLGLVRLEPGFWRRDSGKAADALLVFLTPVPFRGRALSFPRRPIVLPAPPDNSGHSPQTKRRPSLAASSAGAGAPSLVGIPVQSRRRLQAVQPAGVRGAV